MGHVKPMLPLLEGLAGAGLRVVCYGHGDFEAVIASTGATFAPYPSVDYDIHAPDFNLVRMAADLIDASQVIHPALLDEVRDLHPALIVQDFMALWGSRIGTALAVPRVHTVPTLVFNAATRRRMRQEDGMAKLLRDAAQGIVPLARATIDSRFGVSIGEAFGLDGSWRRLAPPVCEIVFCLDHLQPGRPKGRVARHYVGPSFRSGGPNVASTDMKGHALVTFGTLSNNETARFAAAIEGACEAGYSVIGQCGDKVDRTRLEGLARTLEARHPGRTVRVLGSVPDLETLIAGAAVVIHHAGMATTWETVRHSTPALFIPTIADQKVLAGELERNGYGLRLTSGSECDPAAISQGLRRLRGRVPRWDAIHRRIARAGGAERGVAVIRDVLEAVR